MQQERSGCNMQQEKSGYNVQQECRQVDHAQVLLQRTCVLVRVLEVLEFFFRGLGVFFRVLAVLEFFVPTVGCIRMSASQDFWRPDSEIKLGKMALNIGTRI